MCTIFSAERVLAIRLNSIGQLYLPPFEECTLEFMRELISGKKRVSSLGGLTRL